MNPFKYVHSTIGWTGGLAQLEKDAKELTQATANLRSALACNVEPKLMGQAMAGLYDAIAGIQNSLTVLDAYGQMDKGDIERLRQAKMDLWIKKLGGGA